MIISLFKSAEKFTKGLPIIRDIPGFNTLPPGLKTENLRFYKLCNLVHTLGMFVHMSWIPLFFYFHACTLAYVNIASVAIYIFNIVINRNGYHLTSCVIMNMEIIAHQVIAIHFFGLDAGFQYYIVVTTLFPFLMPAGKWVQKGILLAGSIVAFILLDYFYKTTVPVFASSEGLITYLHFSNIIFSFTSVCISGAYFAIAMHETEAALAKKTEELVESEKKATLGNLVTEMAHEIQNPLNFVNNFSEMNEELLQEMKTELEKTNVSDEVKTVLNDLIENSQRINSNGKRVSKIVSALQERVNRGN
jgi:signal transduction histidine kinase